MQKKYAEVILYSVLSCILINNCADNNNPQSVDSARTWACVIADGQVPDYSDAIGCKNDFTALASEPMDASIPGAISAKTVIDRETSGSPLYFMNSKKFPIHWNFVSTHLSGNGKNIVPALREFNETEYYSPDRRFILGAIIYYEKQNVWTYEIASYDKANAAMITEAYQKIADSSFFGDSLYFHPSSQAIETAAKNLPSNVKIITTDELYAGTDYQPLNYGTSYGRLVFRTAGELDTSYVGFRDIVVLDAVPNDISVTSGIITQMFQTPLSHINVLSQNRGTPNMGLRGAFNNADLRALNEKWVKFVVGPFNYSLTAASKEDADAWWEIHKPAAVSIATMNLAIKELKDTKDILDLAHFSDIGIAIDSAIPAFGGKASHFGAFSHMDSAKVPYPKAFAIPVYYYWQFMEKNGFNAIVDQQLTDPAFQDNPAIRDSRLAALRDAIMDAPLDSAFEAVLFAKLNAEYSGMTMRFRSSTNAEDLDGFTGAGLYTSKSGEVDSPKKVRKAIKEVWSSVWYFRAFEERSYRNIDHKSVGMALLVHQSFPDEEATGVAVTSNPFDQSGLEPGFYVNVQKGDESVVLPDSNITTDQFIYHYDMPGQPIVYIAHSSLVGEDSTVLTVAQIRKLGIALKEIHQFFQPIYGNSSGGWYAMDTEFKFDQPLNDPNGEPVLVMKQARPYPGWGKE